MDKAFKFTLPSPNFNKNVQDACKPKQHYLTPSGMSLLPREKQPPPMYGKRGSTLPAKYLKHHAEHDQQNTFIESLPEKQYCEPCEIELNSLDDLKRHRAQHENCPVANCLYKCHPSVMDKHISVLHASGLYDKFKKLSSPEEIAAWRDERRKRYPTLANVLLKQKAKEQRQKRGERLEKNRNRFGNVNDKNRAQLNDPNNKGFIDKKKPGEESKKTFKNNKKRKNRNKSKNVEMKPKVQINENKKNEGLEENELSLNMFKGTSQLKNYKHFNEKKVAAKSALFGLVGMYGSDDEQSSCDSDYEDEIENSDTADVIEKMETNISNNLIEECLKNQDKVNELQENCITDCNLNGQSLETDKEYFKSIKNNELEHETKPLLLSCIASSHSAECNKKQKLSDDEAPEETPIQRSINDYPLKSIEEQKEILLNETENKCRVQKSEVRVIKKQIKKFGLDYRKARFRKQTTMLEKLLENDIRHERNVLLQCVRFVCENNFFDIGKNKNQNIQDKNRL